MTRSKGHHWFLHSVTSVITALHACLLQGTSFQHVTLLAPTDMGFVFMIVMLHKNCTQCQILHNVALMIWPIFIILQDQTKQRLNRNVPGGLCPCTIWMFSVHRGLPTLL